MTNNAIVRLQVSKNISFDEMNLEIKRGGKFITYQYCISIIVLTFRRFSRVHLINSGEMSNKYSNKYNMITYFLGWWGLPFGPIYSIQSIKLNMLGGIDVTDDIIININQTDYEKRTVIIEKSNLIFSPVDNWDKKAVKRAINNTIKQGYKIKNVYLGRQLDNSEIEPPYLTIGIDAEISLDKIKEIVQFNLFKEFRHGTKFQFVDINDETDLSRYLIKQGDLIFNN